MSTELLLALAVGYLLGSIPFGLVLTRLAGKGDVRDIGSGNIGATNVLRTGSKVLAAATLVLDCLKATAAILLVRRLWPDFENFAAAGALIGHLYPVWLKLRGGKGVATLLGVLIPLMLVATVPLGGHYVVDLLGGACIWACWFSLSRSAETLTTRESAKSLEPSFATAEA